MDTCREEEREMDKITRVANEAEEFGWYGCGRIWMVRTNYAGICEEKYCFG